MSVLGLNFGYTVKYNPLPSGVPLASPLGTPSSQGLYLTVYPQSRPNTDTLLHVGHCYVLHAGHCYVLHAEHCYNLYDGHCSLLNADHCFVLHAGHSSVLYAGHCSVLHDNHFSVLHKTTDLYNMLATSIQRIVLFS